MGIFAGTARERFSLVVSLPRNDPALARAAQDAGADALKVHINMRHRASGNTFGSWKEEAPDLRAVLESVSIPVGIVPGAEIQSSYEDLCEMADAGFDFWDVFYQYLPPGFFLHPSIGRMVAINREATPDIISGLEAMGMEMMEMSVVPGEEYGSPLTARELAIYRICAAATTVPALVSSQKKILPGDTGILSRMGVRGLIIGVIVTGSSVESLYSSVTAFKREIYNLGPGR
jgi:hypothetical protein